MIGPAVITINTTALVDSIVDDTIVPELEKERFTGPLTAARGLPFKGIMITHDRPLFWVIANAEIRRVEDLIGKTVAVDRLATLQDIIAEAARM
jgi:hypothetical protein